MIMRRINLSSWISNNKEENRVEVELPGKQGLKQNCVDYRYWHNAELK